MLEVSKASLKALFNETREEMLKMADFYGLPRGQIKQRHWVNAKNILIADSDQQALKAQRKAISSLRFNLQILAYYEKCIPGPQTPERLEEKAKGAESLAKMQEKFGKDDAARQQRTRAKKLRAAAEKLRGEKP